MQSGSYNIQDAELGKKETKVENEDNPLLEMSIQGTCILKEIVEGEQEEPKEDEKTTGGEEKEGDKVEAPGPASESSEDEDSGQEEGEGEEEEKRMPTEVTKENGGDNLPKEYVGVNVGESPPPRSRMPWKTSQGCKVRNKYLWVTIVILALIIFFMAIAWPSKPKEEPAIAGKATEASLAAASPRVTSTTTSATERPAAGSSTPSTLTTTADSTQDGGGDVGTTQTGAPANETEQMKSRVCADKACRSLASRMLAYMDSEANPCDDFYSYACGGLTADGSQWMSKPDLESRTWRRIYDTMMKEDGAGVSNGIRVFKDFYMSCTNYKDIPIDSRIEDANKALQEVGRFYKAAEWNDSTFTASTFTQLLGDLILRQFNRLMEVKLAVDSRNTTKFAWLLTPPSYESWFTDSTGRDSMSKCKKRVTSKMGGPNSLRNRHEEYKSCMATQVKQYTKEIEEALKTLGVDATAIEWRITDLEELLNQLQGMLTNNGNMNPANERTNLFTKFTLNSIANDLPQVEWKMFFERLAGNAQPDDDMEVQVVWKEFISQWLTTTSTWSSRDLNNYLMAMYATKLYYGLVANPECPQEDPCLKQAVNLMPEAASALFLKSFTDKQLLAYEKEITSIFSEIMEMLEDQFGLQKDASSAPISERLGIELLADGGRSVFNNEKYLNELYKGYNNRDTFLDKAVKLQKMQHTKLFTWKNKNPSDPEQIWLHFLRTYSTKGQAVVELNKVVVPYGLMQMLFEENYPKPIQMARLGQVIAKEIWQVLKKKGISQLEVSGMGQALKQCMPRMSNGLFDSNESERQLGKPPIDTGDITYIEKEKGSIDMSEVLDDRIAACLAYSTIWKNNEVESNDKLPWIEHPPEQIFFLAIAQTSCTKSSESDNALSNLVDQHLPPRTRVNAIFRNLTKFMTAFSCPPTTTPTVSDEDITAKPMPGDT